jgi:hypothetical protein
MGHEMVYLGESEMALQDDVISIETRLWDGGPDAYREILDDDCLLAFTRMAGVSTRAEIVGTIEDELQWRDVELDVEGVLQPTSDVAILTYRATAARPGGEQYCALVSSGYVRRDGAWRLMFHQQTPLGAP